MSMKAGFDALHWLVVVVKNDGNFTRAAEQLGVTPSVVSQAMTALTMRYGEPLFARDARSVRLTQIGQMLHDSAELAIAEMQNTQRRISALRATKAASERLRIAYSPSHVATVMKAIQVVIKERGGLTVTTEEADPATVAAKLHKSDGPELGVAYFQSSARRGLDGEEVASRPLALVTNKNLHPLLAKLDKVHAQDLKDEKLALLTKGPLRKLINGYLQRHRPQIVLESNMVASLLAAARVGFASTILPEFPEDSTFAVRRLEPAIIPPTHVLWNIRTKRTEAALAFAAAVKRLGSSSSSTAWVWTTHGSLLRRPQPRRRRSGVTDISRSAGAGRFAAALAA